MATVRLTNSLSIQTGQTRGDTRLSELVSGNVRSLHLVQQHQIH